MYEQASDRLERLRWLAMRARQLAETITDRQTIGNLRRYADRIDEQIRELERDHRQVKKPATR